MSLTLEQFDNAGVGEVSSMLAEIRATIIERDEARANLATRDEYLTGIIAGLDCDDGCGCGKHHCVLDEEAECVTCRLTRERDEARAEVERLRAEVGHLEVERGEMNHALAAELEEIQRLKAGIESGLEEQSLNWHKFTALGETKHRAALEALRERCAVTAGNMFVDDDDNVIGLAVLTSRIRRVPLEEP